MPRLVSWYLDCFSWHKYTEVVKEAFHLSFLLLSQLSIVPNQPRRDCNCLVASAHASPEILRNFRSFLPAKPETDFCFHLHVLHKVCLKHVHFSYWPLTVESLTQGWIFRMLVWFCVVVCLYSFSSLAIGSGGFIIYFKYSNTRQLY